METKHKVRRPCGWRIWLGFLVVVVVGWGFPLLSAAESTELYILWGLEGRWDGQMEVSHGKLSRVLTYSFEEEYSDRLLKADETSAAWQSGVAHQFDGLHLFAETGPATVFHIQTPYGHRDLPISEFRADRDTEVVFRPGKQFLILGRGNPADGPKNVPSAGQNPVAQPGGAKVPTGPQVESQPLCPVFPLPTIYASPKPVDPIRLPDGWWRRGQSLRIDLSGSVDATPTVRRVSNRDGRLYLAVTLKKGFAGAATFRFGPDELGKREGPGPFWISLEPRVARLAIEVRSPETAVHRLSSPTTLIETRQTQLYVNGEPFLVKGTLPRDLNEADAVYLKSLGANTLRGWFDPHEASRYGFMLITMMGSGPAHTCAKPTDEAEFRKQVEQYLVHVRSKTPEAIDSESLLIAQLANEQGGGHDPWTGRYGFNYNGRLDYLLARIYNQVKPLCPMVPCGYSNNMPGYQAPPFLEVYEHNSYLWRDRNASWLPIEDFARWQGCGTGGYRPWVMSEWGANVYMPEPYRFGPHVPVLEKIHAWNYPNRWNTYLAAGVNGGTCYCLYDYDLEKAKKQVDGEWDKGYRQFGVMTFDRHPKLALWELWHLWRDFDLEPAGDGARLTIRYRRPYSARDCRLTLEGAGVKREMKLDDFAGPEHRAIPAPMPERFRWRMDFTTHGGLPMVATGAWPPSIEAEDFLERLKPRDTFGFLKELFDATVMTAEGRSDITTLAEMRREDHVVPVVFKKPNGVAYVTVFHRDRPKKGWYHDGISVDLALSGTVCAVDELTGQPNGRPIDSEVTATGLRLKNLRVPFWCTGYTARASEKIDFPVYRITPAGVRAD